MYRITDVSSLGTEYSITDSTGKIIKTIQVIQYTDILEATFGEYTGNFSGITQYLEQAKLVLSGCDKIDPYRVFWYATDQEEVILADLVEYAIVHDYDKIILEYLEELD